MQAITAYFFGLPGSDQDKSCNAIFKNHAGKHMGSGTLLVGPSAGERDVQYDIPDDEVQNVRQALKEAGFRTMRSRGL